MINRGLQKREPAQEGSVSKVIIVDILDADPEAKDWPIGQQVVNLSVAIS